MGLVVRSGDGHDDIFARFAEPSTNEDFLITNYIFLLKIQLKEPMFPFIPLYSPGIAYIMAHKGQQ